MTIVAPALLALGLVLACWEFVEAVATYAPHLLIGMAFLSLVPLGIQLCLWRLSGCRQVPHPFGAVLPLGLLLILPLWPLGEEAARRCPALCEVAFYAKVKPRRPGKFDPEAVFSLDAAGRGNRGSYGFQLVTLTYTSSRRRAEDLYVRLPQWDGFYTNSYTTFFPVTRETILEYVRGCDEFPPGEAVAVADEVWSLLQDVAGKRNIPPPVYQGWDGTTPRAVYWVGNRSVYLATLALCVPVLFAASWLLAGLDSGKSGEAVARQAT